MACLLDEQGYLNTSLKGLAARAGDQVGGLAQLGERYNGIVEVSGSIPLSSTTLRPYGLRVAQPQSRPLGHPSPFRLRAINLRSCVLKSLGEGGLV